MRWLRCSGQGIPPLRREKEKSHARLWGAVVGRLQEAESNLVAIRGAIWTLRSEAITRLIVEG
jgi:hypothetical protein